MARPIKTTADWFKFSHGFPSSPKMLALRHHYKNRGAMILIYIWDYLLGQDNQCTAYNEATLDIWGINFDEDVQFIKDVVNCCFKYKLLQLDKLNNIFSEDLNDLLSGLHEKRIRDRERLSNSSRSDNGSSRSDNGSSRSDNGSSRSDNGSSRSDNGGSRSDNGGSRSDNGSSRSDNGSSRDLKRRVEKSREKHSTSADIRARDGEGLVIGADDLTVCADVDAEITTLRASPLWKEQVFMRFKFLGINDQLLDEYLQRWGQEVKISGKRHQNLGDAKHHFTNWMIIQEDKLNKNSRSNGTDSNNGYRTGEDIYTGAVSIIKDLRSGGGTPQKELPVV